MGREQYALQYFEVALRLKPFQAAALVGNLSYESTNFIKSGSPRLDPTTGEIGHPGGGFGIAQWTIEAAKLDLADFASRYGLPVTNLGLQFAYVTYQLVGEGKSKYGRLIVEGTLVALQQARSIEEATAVVLAGFERPGGHDGEDYRRVPDFASADKLLAAQGKSRLAPQRDGDNAATFWLRLDRASQVLAGP